MEAVRYSQEFINVNAEVEFTTRVPHDAIYQ